MSQILDVTLEKKRPFQSSRETAFFTYWQQSKDSLAAVLARLGGSRQSWAIADRVEASRSTTLSRERGVSSPSDTGPCAWT